MPMRRPPVAKLLEDLLDWLLGAPKTPVPIYVPIPVKPPRR
jgi:hypothetical protein